MAAIRNVEFDNNRKRDERSGDYDRQANVSRKQRIREAREQELGGASKRNGRNFMASIGYSYDE